MGMNIGSYSSLTSRKGVGGLASGLDTDALIEKMTLGTRQKITNQMQKKQVAMWKQEDYRAISNKLIGFKSKYFTYSNPQTNIMSSKFFQTSTAKPSNSQYVKFSGDAEAARNIKINDIKQLAKSANFSSSHDVTNQKMDSTGKIHEKWRESSLANVGISISVGDKKYAIGLPSNFYLNSEETTPDQAVDKILTELNKSIESVPDLKGKLEFKLDSGTQMVTLQKIPQSDPAKDLGNFRINEGNTNLLTVIGLKSSDKIPDPVPPDPANPVVQPTYPEIKGVHKVRGESAFETSRIDHGIISFKINGKVQRLEIGDFRFSDAAVERDPNTGMYTFAAIDLQRDELKTGLQAAIDKAKYDSGEKDANNKPIMKDLKDILGIVDIVPPGDTAGFSFVSKVADADGKKTIEIAGASSQELLNALGFEIPKKDDPNNPYVPSDTISSKTYDTDKLMRNKELVLSDVLTPDSKDTTISFNLNNITKTITFSAAEKDQFKTPQDLATYLQNKLNKAYGDGKTTVEINADGKLSFAATDPSSVFTIQNSSGNGIMGENGALHMIVGESNRLELSKTLEQAANDFGTTLTANADGKYEMTVNGVDFTFTKDTLVGDVISKINAHPDTGVKITYSSVTDNYSVTARDTGEHTKVDISDKAGGSNLAAVLFGTKGDPNDGYEIKDGQDLKVMMSFDGGKTESEVTRSSNTINVDGANMEILGMADGTIAENISFSVEENSEELYKKVETFINDYNEIVSEITKKTTEKRYGIEDPEDDDTQYLPLTDEQKKEMSDDDIKAWTDKAKMGLLRNDQTMYKVGLSMRTTMSQVTEDGDALFQIGISTAAYAWADDGKLVIDKDKLTEALTNDKERVIKLFTQTDKGIGAKMQQTLESIIGISGAEDRQGILIQMAGRDNTIAPDNSNMTKEIKRMTESLSALKNRLITEENRYWNQFTQLEKYISQMNQQSSWLSGQSG